MPPTKCSYFRCENTSETKSLFRFPADPKLREIWLKNCGNMTITHLPPEKLRSRRLCSDHFDSKYINQEPGHRVYLWKNSIPKPYQDPETEVVTQPHSPSPGPSNLKVKSPEKVYVNKRKQLNIEEREETDDEAPRSTPKKRKIKDTSASDKNECQLLKKKLNRLKCENNSLKKKIKNMKQKKETTLNDQISSYNFSSESKKLLMLMQLKSKKAQWNSEEKKFCMSLYYKSPAAYKFMIGLGIKLASKSTIQRWLQENDCLPGINDDLFDCINNKFSGKSITDRACTVCFDEMSIMVDLEYSNKYDLIEGYEDFGDGDRKMTESKYALVFIARGLYNKWKLPLAYFLSSKTVDSDKLKILICTIINKLFDSELLPKVIICDQATTNVKAIKGLGASVDYPFFFVNGRKIFSIFDTPHLIKNIRNNLLTHDFELNGNKISFNDIIKVYNIDKNNKSKALKKITPVHIDPNNFQKMKVSFATQVLSSSVAGAIKTAVGSGDLESGTAIHTADFVQLCNDLFDSLNSKNKFDSNPYKCAITKNKDSIVNKVLIKGIETFKNLNKITYNKLNNKQLTRPPCFDGMIQTINAVIQLSNEEFSTGTGVKFLITYRLNQDVIENLFGIYRFIGGCNRNPTCRLLRAIFRSNLLNNLMKFDKTNCETDQDVFISTQQNTQHIDPEPSTSSSSETQFSNVEVDGKSSTSTLVCLGHGDHDDVGGFRASNVSTFSSEENRTDQNISLEICSVVYFAGWVGKSCIDKFDCGDCMKMLINNQVDLTDKKQLLLINKTYSNISTPTLKSPTDYLFKLVDKLLDFFNRNIGGLYKANLVGDLMMGFKNEINFNGDYHDLNHFDYLIRKILEAKIHDFCKSHKKSLQSSKSKVRILQNK